MTPTQRRVLEWLVAYPGVWLCATPGTWVNWNVWWVDNAARGSLAAFMGDMGIDGRMLRPTTLALARMGTPRCTRATFQALLNKGWLWKKARYTRDPMGGWYTISRAGIAALQREQDAGVPLVLPEPRPEHSCRCGWRGRSVGGHRTSQRHREWIIVQEYSARVRAQNAALARREDR